MKEISFGDYNDLLFGPLEEEPQNSGEEKKEWRDMSESADIGPNPPFRASEVSREEVKKVRRLGKAEH